MSATVLTRWLSPLTCALLAALAIAPACGDDDDDAGTDSTDTADTAAGGTTADTTTGDETGDTADSSGPGDTAGTDADTGAPDPATAAPCELNPALCVTIDAPATAPVQADYNVVVPSGAIRKLTDIQLANNNLDAVWHEGRMYLAFRTAPSHFASPEVRMVVVSSADLVTWDLEAVFDRDTDLRECRFLSWNGKLFLYIAVLGDKPWAFKPQGMLVTEKRDDGTWAEPEFFFKEGAIPWRTKVMDGVPYMLTYIGGENIYNFTGDGETVYWLTTTDGRVWTPAITGEGADPEGVVLRGGNSETDFEFAANGDLIAVSRNEGGEIPEGDDGKNGRWGMKLCRAKKESLGKWECIWDRKKYDSPLVFKQDGTIYLVGRRTLANDGYFDLERRDLDAVRQGQYYLSVYSSTPKRCSLWTIDPDRLEVNFVQDLPSAGDTCFASQVPLNDRQRMIFNYTSPFEKDPDMSWSVGQTTRTFIYRTTLVFPTPGGGR